MALGSWALLSPWHLARRDYVYDAEEATSYNVISPVLSALALCWLIFACYTNHGGLASFVPFFLFFFFFFLNYDTLSFLSTSFLFVGILNRFLSNYWLLVFSRISYAIYLTQFAVFFYNVGTTRYSSEFQLHTSVRSNSKRTRTLCHQFRVLIMFFFRNTYFYIIFFFFFLNKTSKRKEKILLIFQVLEQTFPRFRPNFRWALEKILSQNSHDFKLNSSTNMIFSLRLKNYFSHVLANLCSFFSDFWPTLYI